MTTHPDREDVATQVGAVISTHLTLVDTLKVLEQAAKAARRTLDLDTVYAAVTQVRAAEEAHDLARLDLDTARGADA